MAQRTIRRPPAPNALRMARFPAPVTEVLRTLDAAGHRSWLVGGAVRDVLLRRVRGAADHDVATPARPAQVMALFPKAIPTGVEHGTVTVVVQGQRVEVTTFRGEGAYADGRRPSCVTFLDDVEGDLARRDFTVNAMAWDPIGQVFRDPFGGRADLRQRVLRAVGDPTERFGEDGLRPVRAARFAAQLRFTLDRKTASAIPATLATVRRVAVERITDELSRLLIARDVRRGLDLLRRTGLLGVVLPELAGLAAPALTHAFAVTAASPPELTVRVAALLHRAPSALGPGAGSVVATIMGRLRFAGAVRDGAVALLTHHRCLAAGDLVSLPEDDAETRRWLARVGAARDGLLALGKAEVRAMRSSPRVRRRTELAAFARRLRRVLAAGPPLGTAALALDGRGVMEVLGVDGGPAVGAALRYLLDRVLTDPGLNTPERLTSELVRWQAAQAPSGATVAGTAGGMRSGVPRERRPPR